MTEATTFAHLSRMIRLLAEHEYFRKGDRHRLQEQFQDPGKADVYLRSRPYKFGIYRILTDVAGKRSGSYHNAIESRVAFELLKRLVDIHNETTDADRRYLRKLVRGVIKEKGQDLASVLTEIEAYVSFKPHVTSIQIGDGMHSPDVRVFDDGEVYDLQCKSLGISDEEIGELEGLFTLVKTLHVRAGDLRGTPAFAAWLLKDRALAQDDGVREAIAVIDNFIEFAMRKTCVLVERARVMDLIHHSRTNNITGFFEKAFPPPGTFIPMIPELIAKPGELPPPYAFLLMRVRNADDVAKRALKSFDRAMEQHRRMKSKNPIVYINIEYPSALMQIAPIGPLLPNDQIFQSAAFYQGKISEKIKGSPGWETCRGLVLTSSVAPRKSRSDGISWNRVMSFLPGEGLSEEQAFPPFAAMRKSLKSPGAGQLEGAKRGNA